MVENTMVSKHNQLIEARYKLNLNEQKIILYAVSKLDSIHQKEFNIIEISIDEFTELIGTTQERYTEIKNIVKNLMKKQVEIDIKEGNLIANWVSSIEYKKNTGKVELEFSVKLKPYLLQLKECYKSYKLKNVINFKNKYAIRIYELLKQYENMKSKERTIKLDELKKMLGCEDKYKEFSNFNKFVLQPSKSEILKYSDLCFEYEKIKNGRKIVAIKFIFEKNHSNIEKPTDTEYMIETGQLDEYITKLRKDMPFLAMEFLSDKQINELYEIACEKCPDNPYKYVEINYYYTKGRKIETTVFSYLKGALKEGYIKI
jgi:plasmid replication initiation protein